MKKISLLTIILLILLILFRNNILIACNNIYNLFLQKNNINNAEIKLLKSKINYLEKEYNELNNFKNVLPQFANYNYFVSRVIYRENYFYNSEILIEGGKKNNIKEGMAVINEYGLIGITTNVNEKVSKIKLLQNIDNLSVNINDFYGKLIYKDGEFIIKDISKDSMININDEIYTSTLGSVKEKIYIGRVSEVKDDIIEKRIIMESEVDFNKLNYLIVVGDI